MSSICDDLNQALRGAGIVIMPLTKETAMQKETLQAYADAVVAPEFRQPLKTVEEACAAVGWEVVDHPQCCGKPVELRSFLGVYHAHCPSCGKFIRDMRAPTFEGACAYVLDTDRVDTQTEVAWIAGQKPQTQPGE